MKKIICITGISGSGKTTVGKFVSETLRLHHIDQDLAFKPEDELPETELHPGHFHNLYDSKDALDMFALRELIEMCRSEVILLTGFRLERDYIEHEIPGSEVIGYVILNIDTETCIQRRQLSKIPMLSYSQDPERVAAWKKKDKLMVHYHVVPFFQEGVQKIREDANFVPVFEIDGTERLEIVRLQVQDRVKKIMLRADLQ